MTLGVLPRGGGDWAEPLNLIVHHALLLFIGTLAEIRNRLLKSA